VADQYRTSEDTYIVQELLAYFREIHNIFEDPVKKVTQNNNISTAKEAEWGVNGDDLSTRNDRRCVVEDEEELNSIF
jgi:hypothetical protein